MWCETEDYLAYVLNKTNELRLPLRVAGFDLDDTLITHSLKTVVGWTLTHPTLPKLVSELIENKHIIVIFTNQAGMSRNTFNIQEWKDEIVQVINQLTSQNDQFYLALYAAKKHDRYRKPNRGLWDLMKEDLKGSFKIKKFTFSKKSFFCGDAGGRMSKGLLARRKDFSDTDRKLAMNLNITYFTPENFILKDARQEPFKLNVIGMPTVAKYKFIPREKELILMVGFPAIGKTTFVKKYILPCDYVYVNNDRQKKNSSKIFNEAIENNESIVIDNTNLDIKKRMEYTMYAVKHGYTNIRAIVMETDIGLCKHLNNVRHLYTGTPKIAPLVYTLCSQHYTFPV